MTRITIVAHLLLLPAAAAMRAPMARSTKHLFLYCDPTHEQADVEQALHGHGADAVLLSRNAALAGSELEDGRVVNRMPQPGDEESWAKEALPAGAVIRGVLCGDDAGLADAERLAHALCPSRANGIHSGRRDKYLMNEVLRSAGIACCAQLAPASWAETQEWLRNEENGGLPAILKPRRGVASILVGLAQTESEAESMYEALSVSGKAGAIADDGPDDEVASRGTVVVQEYLDGDEWIVDTVSRDGHHKVVALWRYDKGEANGAPFVYFGVSPEPSAGAEAQALTSYALRALDALGWRWGPCHLEIKLTRRGPRLVETNMGRWNGIPFKRLSDQCIGRNAYDLTLAAFLDGDARADAEWAACPDVPPPSLRARGQLVHLVSHVSGKLRRLRHGKSLSQLPSLVHFAPRFSSKGEVVRPTTCFNSCAGEAHLVHPDPQVVARDYALMRRLQPSLFAVARPGLLSRLSALSNLLRGRRPGRSDILYVRRGYVLRRVRAGVGGKQYTAAQMIVDSLQMQPGIVPVDGSMAGVMRVRVLSAAGETSMVEVQDLRGPTYEVVATMDDA